MEAVENVSGVRSVVDKIVKNSDLQEQQRGNKKHKEEKQAGKGTDIHPIGGNEAKYAAPDPEKFTTPFNSLRAA